MTITEFVKLYCKKKGISYEALLKHDRSIHLVNLRAEIALLLKNKWNAKNSVIAIELNREVSVVRNLLKRGVKPGYKEPKNIKGLFS